MKKILDFVVRSNKPINYQNHLLIVTPLTNEKLPSVFPGQFVQILVPYPTDVFLRRPISINYINEETNEMWLLVQNVGKGTEQICATKEGETLNIIFPLGSIFSIPANTLLHPLLIGGGVGVAPLLFLGKKLKEKGFSPEFILGGRSERDLLQVEDFEKYGTVYCTTEDGSKGEKGFVTHHSILSERKYDIIYTCGPRPMMMAVAAYARQYAVECEVSLENMMACGFGVCGCCVEKTTTGNRGVCADGPVFNIKELTWTD